MSLTIPDNIKFHNQESQVLPIINNEMLVNSKNIEVDEQNKKKNRKEIYGKGIEAKTIKEELGDFDVTKSKSYQSIITQFGRSIRFSELLGIVNSIQFYLQTKKNVVMPQISRNEKRSFPLLIKYIDRNVDLIIPYIQYISLCDSNYRKIPLDTK